MKKLLLVVAALAISATMANAAVVASTLQTCSAAGFPLSTIGGGCTLTDKDFTAFTTWGGYTAFPGDWRLSIDISDNTHIVDLARSGGTQIGPGTYGIQYNVDVLKGAGMLISKVNININPSTALATLYKEVRDLTAGNVGFLLGSGSNSGNVIGGTNFNLVPPSAHIQVRERLTITSGKAFSSFTDAYTQVTPEPATYAMMGLGLAALGLISRRKKA